MLTYVALGGGDPYLYGIDKSNLRSELADPRDLRLPKSARCLSNTYLYGEYNTVLGPGCPAGLDGRKCANCSPEQLQQDAPSASLDQIAGAGEQRERHSEAEHLRRHETEVQPRPAVL